MGVIKQVGWGVVARQADAPLVIHMKNDFSWRQEGSQVTGISMNGLVDEFGFQLLQFIGLSLPAVALYMTVLTEVFMRPFVKQIPTLEREGSSVRMTPENTEHQTVTITSAQSTYEFIAAELALGMLTFSGILVIGAIVLTSSLVFLTGLVIAAIGYIIFGISPLLLAYKTIREASMKSKKDA
ncbi:hypothetical protein U4E84_04195 [Halorubrum sp. AD140]|uniref:hypothetical protein n=1 Tax=Halorubrum sp. AD140 TaxID=3050073 RepID=UPI002ACC70E9|nr:hypothetical protein [Halorubrum sp. AD140]MDZ5810549.1 hypothetical protein [Halorubrum sp. AD140]